MVKAVAEPERLTPAAAALVMFWAMMTPKIGRIHIDDAAGMILVHAEDLQLLDPRQSRSALASLLGVVGLLEHGLGNRAMLEQILRAEVGLVGQLLVIDRLQIGIEGIGDVRALHPEQQLALLHVVVEAHLDIDDAAVGEGDDRNLARDIREDGSGGVQFRG